MGVSVFFQYHEWNTLSRFASVLGYNFRALSLSALVMGRILQIIPIRSELINVHFPYRVATLLDHYSY